MGTENNSKSPLATPARNGGSTIAMVDRKNYIITIGIDKYKNSNIPVLTPCCENDCRGLLNVLEQDYSFETISKRYDRQNAITEKEAMLFNEEATLSNIKDLFDYLRYHPDFDNRQKEAVKHNMIIYYSGQGLHVLLC